MLPEDPFEPRQSPFAQVPQPPPLPPPLSPRRWPRTLGITAVAVGSLVSGALGVAVGVAVSRQSQSTASTSVLPNTNASNGQAPANPGTSSNGASAGSSVAATVSQAVVDITATTSNGAVAGTGMVLTSDGEVLTNNHVIAGTTNIKVQIDGTGPRYSATVLGDDATDDIALLKIQGVSGLKTVSIGQASSVSVGDAVLAIGNAGNRPGAPTATSGSIIAVGRTITAGDQTGSSETLSGLFQIDAVLEPGDSGGPLVDSTGHVIGMDTAAQSGPAPQSASAIGFAIPIDKALSIVKQIESGAFNSTVQSGQGAILGVEISTGGVASRPGAAVVGVRSGSPAQAAGLAAGDVITSVGGRTIDSQSALQSVIRSYRPGENASVVWITASGQQRSANITFASGPPA